MLHQLIHPPFNAVEEAKKAGNMLYLCFDETLRLLGLYLKGSGGICLWVSLWGCREGLASSIEADRKSVV